MFKLFDKISWLVSIIFGTQIVLLFVGYRDFWDGGWVVAVILAILIKAGFLSGAFIKERLQFFADQLGGIKEKEPLSTTLPAENFEETVEEEKIDSKPPLLWKEPQKLKEDGLEETPEIKKPSFQNIALEQKQETTQKYIKREPSKPTAFELFFAKLGKYIVDFFSTNLLAKLGAILVFLSVVYFLKGVIGSMWEAIGPVGRIITGISSGFLVYFIGVRLHKKLPNEGLILMGTGILINYATILAGRYIVGDDGYLAEGTSFLFLILNTVFAVATSLVYRSKVLLIFAFIFAYINPFIIGAQSNGQPYTLIAYSFIVSLGGLFLANQNKNNSLLLISFIAGNLLFLLAPFSDSLGWSSKIIITSILSLITIYAGRSRKITSKTSFLSLFIMSYIFVILNLLYSGGMLSNTISFIVYNIILLSFFVGSILIIKKVKENISSSSILLFSPLFILAAILFSGQLVFIPFILLGTMLVYLFGFSILQDKLSSATSALFWGVLAIFIIIFQVHIRFIFQIGEVSQIEFITLIVTSIVFLFSSYFFSKKQMSILYAVGTIGTIFILSPIIDTSEKHMLISIVAIIIFALSNWALPFIRNNLSKPTNFQNLLIGSIAGVLFLAFQLYNFGQIYFSGVALGFSFLALAIIYFIQAFFISQKVDTSQLSNTGNNKNIFYTFSGISISLFSVAIAFVFSNYPEIISTIWLFEATILYYFYSKKGSGVIFSAATILFFIGLSKFTILVDIVSKADYLFLVSFAIIFVSFMLNLRFINKIKNKEHISHQILHIFGMGIMGLLLIKIIPSTGHGWSSLGISFFLLILSNFYTRFSLKILQNVFIIALVLFSFLHIAEIDSIFRKLVRDDLEIMKTLQYLVTFLIFANKWIWTHFEKAKSSILSTMLAIYLFIITSIYVLDLFSGILGNYSLTIYWGLIASSFLIYGIQKDIIKYRTTGLYFLVLTTAKIAYDLLQIKNTDSLVITLLLLGITFFIIGTLYTKKYGDNLAGEFSLDNLKDDNQKVGIK